MVQDLDLLPPGKSLNEAGKKKLVPFTASLYDLCTVFGSSFLWVFGSNAGRAVGV